MAGHMCRIEELQGLPSVSDLHIDFLLGLLCRDFDMAVE